MKHSIHSPHEAAIIDSLQYQGTTNDCAPYTIATILNALTGTKIDASALARNMDKPVWRGVLYTIRRIPRWATFPWGIVDVFREHGINANWGLFFSTDDLKHNLENGNLSLPIICSFHPLSAHVLTLLAWHPLKGWGFANTQHNTHRLDWISNKQFIKQWNLTARLLIEVHIQ